MSPELRFAGAWLDNYATVCRSFGALRAILWAAAAVHLWTGARIQGCPSFVRSAAWGRGPRARAAAAEPVLRQPGRRTYLSYLLILLSLRPHRAEALSDAFVWRLSVAYIGPNSRTARPRKTKIGTEVAHVTRDLDTTFKVKSQRSRVNLLLMS